MLKNVYVHTEIVPRYYDCRVVTSGNVRPCIPKEAHRRFERTCWFHKVKEWAKQETTKKQAAKKDPEDEGSRLLRKMVNFCWSSWRYNPTRWSRGSALDLNSGGTWLESWPGQLLILRFAVYLSPSKCWDSTYIRPLPLSSKSFPIHYSCHATIRRHLISTLNAPINNLRKKRRYTIVRLIATPERTWNRI
jgi:hypothetical protein